MDKTEPVGIFWPANPILTGTRYKHRVPDSVMVLLDSVIRNEPLPVEKKEGYKLQVAPKPFSDAGAMRLAYHARAAMVSHSAANWHTAMLGEHVGAH